MEAIIGGITELWVDIRIFYFWKYFVDNWILWQNIENVSNILEEEVDEEQLVYIKKICEEYGLPESIIRKIFFEKDLSNSNNEYMWWNIDIETEKSLNMINIEQVNKSNILDFNPHLETMNMTDWIKLLWEIKYKQVFKEIFVPIVKKFLQNSDWYIFEWYDIHMFDASKLLWQKLPQRIVVPQHIVEWKLPKHFQEKQIINIWKLFKHVLPDMNLKLSPYKPYKRNYINTFKWGELEYMCLTRANCWFENENITIIKDKKTAERRLYIALWADINQDQFLFLTTQVGYFIKNNKFLDTAQLYAQIYHQYNLLQLENIEVFDACIFEKQYKSIVKNVIWPLSLEYIQKYWKVWKTRNSLLVWVYGTSKSQFLFNLIKHREFKINWKILHLNANVISLDIINFGRLVKNDIAIKKRISDIYNKTKLPIIVLIEDIDTLTVDDVFEQAITTLMDWLWSVPITIITAVNYPDKIPNRVIRPNRLENIVKFDIPMDKKIIKYVLNIHLKRNWIEKIITKNIIGKLLPYMEYWTPSHIQSFVKNIKDYIEFENMLWNQIKIDFDVIKSIIENMLIPVWDIKELQKEIDKWYEKVSNWDKSKIWFGK